MTGRMHTDPTFRSRVNRAVVRIRETFPDRESFLSDPGGWLAYVGPRFAEFTDEECAAAIEVVEREEV